MAPQNTELILWMPVTKGSEALKRVVCSHITMLVFQDLRARLSVCERGTILLLKGVQGLSNNGSNFTAKCYDTTIIQVWIKSLHHNLCL